MEAPPTSKAIHLLRRQEPLDPNGISRGKEQQLCPLWKAYRAEKIIGRGLESIAVLVRQKDSSSGRKFIAKFTPMSATEADQPRQKILATAGDASPEAGREFRPDSLYSVEKVDPWQVPAVRPPPAFAELHNWIVAQHVLRPNSESSRLYNASNMARLHDWTWCEWTTHDSVMFFVDSPDVKFEFLPEEAAAVTFANLIQERRDRRENRKFEKNPEEQFSRKRVSKHRIDVQILLLDYVKGETLSVSIKQRMPIPYPYQKSKQFFDAWTQIACTKSFLEKRAHFDHGDFHPKNVMSESTDQAFPQQAGPRKPVLLIYDLPLTDQLGRTFDWRFYVYEPERIVRIIDFGRARSKLEFEEDLRSAPKELGPADKLTWMSGFPDAYALRGDLFAFATGAFLEMARILQYATDFDSKAADEMYDIGRVAFHALERRPYDHGPRLLAEELKPRWQRHRLSNPDRKALATFGEELHKAVLGQTQITYACVEQKQRGGECALPPPLAGEDQAGRWTVDEHLAFFAPQLGGFSKASGYRPASVPRPEWLERYTVNPAAFYAVEMLPRDRPKAFPRETLDPKRNVSYPIFRGRETGDPELDDHMRRYVFELGAANPQ